MIATEEFHQAVCAGDLTRVRTLLDSTSGLVWERHEGATPLHYAAMEGHRELTGFLLSRGAEIDAVDEEHAMTPIAWANERGRMEMVHFLFSRGAKVNFAQAAGFGLLEQLRLYLKKYPSRINEAGSYGAPLHEAALWGRPEAVELLLEHGADASAKNRDGLTPLEIASRQIQDGARATPLVLESRRQEILEGCRKVVERLCGKSR